MRRRITVTLWNRGFSNFHTYYIHHTHYVKIINYYSASCLIRVRTSSLRYKSSIFRIWSFSSLKLFLFKKKLKVYLLGWHPQNCFVFFNSTQTKMSCFATEWHSFLKFLWKPSPVHFLHDDVSSHLLLYYYTYIRLLLFDQLAERFGCCAAKGLYISVGTFTFQIITKWDLGMRDMLEDSWVEVFLQPFMFVYSVLGRVVLWQTVLSFGMSYNSEVFFTFMLFHVWFFKVDRKPSASEIDFLYHSDSGIHIKNDICSRK